MINLERYKNAIEFYKRKNLDKKVNKTKTIDDCNTTTLFFSLNHQQPIVEESIKLLQSENKVKTTEIENLDWNKCPFCSKMMQLDSFKSLLYCITCKFERNIKETEDVPSVLDLTYKQNSVPGTEKEKSQNHDKRKKPLFVGDKKSNKRATEFQKYIEHSLGRETELVPDSILQKYVKVQDFTNPARVYELLKKAKEKRWYKYYIQIWKRIHNKPELQLSDQELDQMMVIMNKLHEQEHCFTTKKIPYSYWVYLIYQIIDRNDLATIYYPVGKTKKLLEIQFSEFCKAAELIGCSTADLQCGYKDSVRKRRKIEK